MARVEPVYTVHILYKSGQTMTMRVTDFRIQGGRYTWSVHASSKVKPIQLGADDIAAVWQDL